MAAVTKPTFVTPEQEGPWGPFLKCSNIFPLNEAPTNKQAQSLPLKMAARIAARYVSRRLSTGGKVLAEEEKAAENVYIKVYPSMFPLWYNMLLFFLSGYCCVSFIWVCFICKCGLDFVNRSFLMGFAVFVSIMLKLCGVCCWLHRLYCLGVWWWNFEYVFLIRCCNLLCTNDFCILAVNALYWVWVWLVRFVIKRSIGW